MDHQYKEWLEVDRVVRTQFLELSSMERRKTEINLDG